MTDQTAQPDESKKPDAPRGVKIYTKKGDLGFTTLLGSSDKIPKWSPKIKAYGAVDELNAHLGKVREILIDGEWNGCRLTDSIPLVKFLMEDVDVIQRVLFIASSWLARSDYLDEKPTRLRELDESMVTGLETMIDQMTARLPVLKNFILQTGEGTCDIHIARAVCRRAESRVAKAVYEARHFAQYALIVVYLNRLSDWLFTVARYYAQSVGQDDVRL